jgi:hypothetical protein
VCEYDMELLYHLCVLTISSSHTINRLFNVRIEIIKIIDT